MLFAFIDESGDNGLDFNNPGTSCFFVISAVLVSSERLPDFEREVRSRISGPHFQGSEIKSSKIGKKHDRRLKVLQALDGIPFKTITLIVDKRRLAQDGGFKYKDSFYKFMHRQVDQELFKRFQHLKLMADEFGDKPFMDSFREYIYRHHPRTLFSDSDFEFVSSASQFGVQVADLIVGSMAKALIHKDETGADPDFLSVLNQYRLHEIVFPPPQYPLGYQPESEATSPLGHIVDTQARRMARIFIQKNATPKDQPVIDQVNCVRYLLMQHELVNSSRYISSHEICEHLNAFRPESLTPEVFRSGIIAKLRDAEVLVVSTASGYKMPAKYQELIDHFSHQCQTLIPMLQRLGRYRDMVKVASQDELDIFRVDEFAYIGKALESLATVPLLMNTELEVDESLV